MGWVRTQDSSLNPELFLSLLFFPIKNRRYRSVFIQWDHLCRFCNSVILTSHISLGSVASTKYLWEREVHFGRFPQTEHLCSKKSKVLYLWQGDQKRHARPFTNIQAQAPPVSWRQARATSSSNAWEDHWWSHWLVLQPPFLPLPLH